MIFEKILGTFIGYFGCYFENENKSLYDTELLNEFSEIIHNSKHSKASLNWINLFSECDWSGFIHFWMNALNLLNLRPKTIPIKVKTYDGQHGNKFNPIILFSFMVLLIIPKAINQMQDLMT